MNVVEGQYSVLWQANEVLYARCPRCFGHLPWRVFHGTCNLVAACCGYCFTAEPFFRAQKFKVTEVPASPVNVVQFKNIVDM